MKKVLFFAMLVLLASCKDNCNPPKDPPKDPPTPGTDTSFINKDTADVMIESYLQSISRATDTPLNCLIVNADSLRAYLNDTNIKNVKLMFAHTQAYINAGNTGVPAGYKAGALTIVLAGYNRGGDYVYYNGNQVLDNAMPCPTDCPHTGTAQQNVFP